MKWAIKYGDRVSAEPNLKARCPVCNQELISKCGSIKIWHWSHKSNKDCDNWYEPETQWHRDWKNQFPKEKQEVTIGKHRADIKTSIIIELQNSSISSDDIKERENFYGNMIWLLNGEKFAKNLILREKNSQELNSSNYSDGKLFNRVYKKIYTFRWKQPPKSWWFANKEVYIDLNHFSNYYLDLYNNVEKRKIKWKDKISQSINSNDTIPKDLNKQILYFERTLDCNEEFQDLLRKQKIYWKMYSHYENKIFLIKKIYPNIPCGGWGELIDKEEFLKRFR